jgi:hypothetical protein
VENLGVFQRTAAIACGAMRPSTDRAQRGNAPAFLTKEVLLRFEEGLRAQREQRARSDQPTKQFIDGGASLCRACYDKVLFPPKEQSRLVQPLGMLGSAAVNFLLGIVILAYWPVSSIYILGLLLGIDLVFAGAVWIAIACGPR